MHSTDGGEEPVERAVSTYNTNKEQSAQRGTPQHNPKEIVKESKTKGPTTRKTRKNRATPDRERVPGTGPRTREEAGAGEKASRPR
jgi:hypothetical protein